MNLTSDQIILMNKLARVCYKHGATQDGASKELKKVADDFQAEFKNIALLYEHTDLMEIKGVVQFLERLDICE